MPETTLVQTRSALTMSFAHTERSKAHHALSIVEYSGVVHTEEWPVGSHTFEMLGLRGACKPRSQTRERSMRRFRERVLLVAPPKAGGDNQGRSSYALPHNPLCWHIALEVLNHSKGFHLPLLRPQQ